MQTEQIAPTETSALLLEAAAALRRALRGRAADAGTPGLSVSEVELFKIVARRPGLRVGEAAAALRLAPNSVSTLGAQLERKGLIVRRAHAGDARGVTLHLTAAGQARRRRWRDRREELVAQALAGLKESELEALERALPAYTRLVQLLEEA